MQSLCRRARRLAGSGKAAKFATEREGHPLAGNALSRGLATNAIPEQLSQPHRANAARPRNERTGAPTEADAPDRGVKSRR